MNEVDGAAVVRVWIQWSFIDKLRVIGKLQNGALAIFEYGIPRSNMQYTFTKKRVYTVVINIRFLSSYSESCCSPNYNCVYLI